MTTYASRCDRCGETITDLDAGFSPAVQGMGHANCGGKFQRVTLTEDQPPEVEAEAKPKMVTCECDNGHRWQTDDPQRDLRCPQCGQYWV